jgi:hypothetical protein
MLTVSLFQPDKPGQRELVMIKNENLILAILPQFRSHGMGPDMEKKCHLGLVIGSENFEATTFWLASESMPA